MKYLTCFVTLILVVGFISTEYERTSMDSYCGDDGHYCRCLCNAFMETDFGCTEENGYKSCFCRYGTKPEKMDVPNSTYEEQRGLSCRYEVLCPCVCGKDAKYFCYKTLEYIYQVNDYLEVTECVCADENGEGPKGKDVPNSTVDKDEDTSDSYCGSDEHVCRCVCKEFFEQDIGCEGEDGDKDCFCKYGTQPKKVDVPNSTYEEQRGLTCGDETTCPCVCGKYVGFNCKEDGCVCSDK